MVTAVVAGYGVATPRTIDQSRLWDDFFAAHTGDDPRAKRIFANSGVDSRHCVVSPLTEDISTAGTAERLRRYAIEALPLGEKALVDALADADTAVRDLGMLVVVSCTGYDTPGLDIQLAHRLGASADLQRVCIGHMGCYAAIPAVRTAADYVRQSGRPAAVLCVELTSLHLQPGPLDTEQAVAHALFSDAAAAVVLCPEPAAGLEVVDVTSRTDLAHRDAMTWRVTDTGFRMTLSARVPLVLARQLPDAVTALLARHELRVSDIDGWAVHPGGRKILDVARRALNLPDTATAGSANVLRRHGNCSSPTVLIVLRDLAAARTPPRDVVALAFGPGLTLYAALLRATT